jgi:hypothetical protein
MIQRLPWFERKFSFGLPAGMLPFYLDRLEGTIVRMEEKVEGHPEALLSETFEEKWSVKQHIGHLAEVDRISSRRIDEMVRGTEVLSPAVFEPQDYNPWPIAKVLTFFRESRESNLERYELLSAAELMTSSIHPRLKVRMTPVDLAFFDAEHDDHHLLKISDIIKEYGQR